MYLYLIRHGETDQNRKKCLQGRSDIELNENGRELAGKTAEGLKDVKFDLIFTSPLKRARETAEIIRGKRNIPLLEEDRLLEISFGEYEGLSFGVDTYTIPDPEFMNFFQKPEAYRVPPAGEAFASVIERTGSFLKELLETEEYREKTILLSTHGCALKALLANVTKVQVKDFWGAGVHKNCGVTLLKVTDGEVQIVEEGKVYY